MVNGAKAVYGPQLDVNQRWDMKIMPIFKNSNYYNPSLAEGCSTYSKSYSEIIKGKVIMVNRGGCFFSEKTLYAMKAGASGIIIANSSDQVFNMSPYKETKFDPIQHKNLLNKFKELKQEVIDIVDNNIPFEKRKQEEDEYTIPSMMISKSDSEYIMRAYLQPISEYPKNEFRNLLKLYQTIKPIHSNLSWDLMGFKLNELTKIKTVDLQYDNKIINNIKIIKTRRRKVMDIISDTNNSTDSNNDNVKNSKL